MEWCTVWKGSVRDCLDHLLFMDAKTLGKFFPPWTVSRDIRNMALCPDVSGVATDVKLFHEAGCRLVHRYRIYRDPMPHVSLRGKVISNLIGFVNRAMAVAKLTHLHLTIPSSESTTGPVKEGC